MEFKRGRYYKKWINCPEDKRIYDIINRADRQANESLASDYCLRFAVPDISLNEKNEISAYWEQFGIKINDYSWHRMYYYVTGIHDPRFVPDLVAGLILYEYYNDRIFENTWRDKNMFDILLPNVPFPKTYGKCIRNRFFLDDEYFTRNSNDTLKFANGIFNRLENNDIIIKVARATGFGRGVKKYHVQSVTDMRNALNDWEQCENFTIQKCIRQHNVFQNLNESSLNILRICSWRHQNEVDILYAASRVGIPGAITDISFVGGKEIARIVGISKDGIFDSKMLDQDGRMVKELGGNIPVPAWEKIKSIIKANHRLIDNFDIIGWDFCVDENCQPSCLEWNIHWPGTVFYQYVNGPLCGEQTNEIFAFLKSEYNRYNYIPYFMRL